MAGWKDILIDVLKLTDEVTRLNRKPGMWLACPQLVLEIIRFQKPPFIEKSTRISYFEYFFKFKLPQPINTKDIHW